MDLRTALQRFGADTKKKLQEAVPVATGKTKQSIHYKTTYDSVSLYQRGGWFGALIDGRPPRAKAEDTGLAGALLAWMTAVGGVDGIPTNRKGAGRLAWLINKYGTRLHQGKAISKLEGFTYDQELAVLRNSIGDELMKSVKLSLLKVTKS